MIEIIKAPKQYEISCGYECYCRFRFTKGDVKEAGYNVQQYVTCPCCGEKLYIKRLSDYEVKENNEEVKNNAY